MREMTLEEMRMVTGGLSYGPPDLPPEKLGLPNPNCPSSIPTDSLDEAVQNLRSGHFFTGVTQVVTGAPEMAANLADRAVAAALDQLGKFACSQYSLANGPNTPITCPVPVNDAPKK
jgi:hypothetical protein